MCGVHPDITPIAKRAVKQIKVGKKPQFKAKGLSVTHYNYQLDSKKPLGTTYKEMDNVADKVSNDIKSDSKGYRGTFIYPTHLKTTYANYLLLKSLFFTLHHQISEKSSKCGTSWFDAFPCMDATEGKMPKIELISFFKK